MPEIGRLTKLQHLRLDGAHISDRGLTELGNLNQLKSLVTAPLVIGERHKQLESKI